MRGTTLWLIDVDGPIVDPATASLSRPEVLEGMVALMARGEPVALNTGRSLPWLIEMVVPALEASAEALGVAMSVLAERFLIVGEKGGVTAHFSKGGTLLASVDDDLRCPDELRQAVTELVGREFRQTMFMDESKRGMITVEKLPGIDIGTFHAEQSRLVAMLAPIVARYSGLRIDPTEIAVDIQEGRAGKARGAHIALDWAASQGMRISRGETIGDSPSDVEMADELARRGISVTFHFVGAAGAKVPHARAGVVVTRDAPYVDGTADIMRGTLPEINSPSKGLDAA